MSEPAITYYCDLCQAERDGDVCEECGLPTRRRNAPAATAPVAVEAPSHPPPPPDPTPTRIFRPPAERAASPENGGSPKEPPSAHSAAQAPPPPPAATPQHRQGTEQPAREDLRTRNLAVSQTSLPAEAPTRSQRRATPDEPRELTGQKEVEEYLDRGFEIFLIVGIAGAGKTQLLEAFRGGQDLTEVEHRGQRALPTPPGSLKSYPFVRGKRQLLFVDASGEHFQRLQADPLRGRQIRAHDVQFLRLVSRRLAGLVMLLNLEALWSDVEVRPEHREQPRILANILGLLRWLQGGGEYQEDAARPFAAQVDSEARAMKRLRPPVQLLFSHADQLAGRPLPTRPEDSWLGGAAEGRPLHPLGEQPLLLLHHYLPKLLAALEDHCHCFRVDFVHSLSTDPDTEAVVDPQGCGVDLAREWLVEASRRPPWIPTRRWLRLQRFADDRLRRRANPWIDLPDPVGLGVD